ncbi:ABC transporter substrate-binding protein [Paenibacillus radicis (ex Xue et al. 2023)]|uniref:Sugar ABC transporter substrate-binding protein n=1 Tax=Paenibacillus radicis (ex Xue et al. 2023) TaxID=2972489 RepID=A0ABT1YIG5_9BACL|nr:sugar ABC transporter substrate-binding protein [Paenibacillus radicis (ex Xue et al. 2023)]MCR8632980.1 sugar ABC transporter substrate-binding protein [Paenibacillus radicis (ex Xue et al. 2023)]
MKRLSMIVAMMLLIFAVALSGCSTSGGGDKSQTSAKKEEVTIKVAGFSDFFKGDDSPGMKVVKDFNEKNKGQINVVVQYMPSSQYSTAIQAAIAGNDLPDIFLTPQGMDLRQIVKNGWAKPMDEYVSKGFKDRFTQGSFEDGVNVFDGKTYSWPLGGQNLRAMLYYNKTVMKDAGLDPNKPPKTWDELREMSKVVSQKGKGDVYGLIFAGGETTPLDQTVMGLTAGSIPTHGDIPGFNLKTGKYIFDSKEWIDAVKLLQTMKKDGSILPSSYSLKAAEATVFFGENKAAFFIDARYRMWQVKRDVPKAEFDMAPVPQQDGKETFYGYTLASRAGYMISAHSKHPEIAGKFIDEAFASKEFFKSTLQSGVSMTPIDELNKDKSLYPYPEFNTFYNLHASTMRLGPSTTKRNPNTATVIAELGEMRQSKVKPIFGDLLIMLLMEDKGNVETTLKDYNNKLNAGLQAAIDKVNKSGANVSLNDFTFPNWDPAKDYTDDLYKALK